MKKARKWLSILLTVSLIAAMVIIPTTVSAANGAVAYKQLIYSQDFNDADKVKLSANWGAGITETEVWCGYNSALNLAPRSEETPEDLCLVRPDGNGTVYTIFTLPFEITDTDDTTYEISFDYYATGDEICYLEGQPYVRLQTADTLAPGQWHKVEMVFNAKQKTFTTNGVSYQGSFNSSYKYIQFAQGNPNTNIDAKFDNFKIYKYVYPPTVNGISFVDAIGIESTDTEAVKPSIKTVKINIDNAASLQEILDNFEFYNDDTKEDEPYENPKYENNIFSFEIPDGLEANSSYIIEISNEMKNSKGETGEGAYITFSTANAVISGTLSAIDKELIYSQDFNDKSKVKLSDNWGTGITETEVWCGYNSALNLAPRSEETPEDLCLVRPDGNGTVYTIFTLPFEITDTDDTTYEISFDYYATGDEICYLEGQPYVRLQTADTLAPGQWHKVEMVINLKQKTFTVNGVDYDPAGSFKSSYKYIQFAQGNSNTNTDAKFDNFKIYKRLPVVSGVNASISNETGQDADLYMIFAGYKEAGNPEDGAFELQTVELKPIKVLASDKEKSVSIDIPKELEQYDSAKAFLWELNSLVPIAESLIIK